MTGDAISELRQLHQHAIAPDLKSLAMKIDGVQRQMELSQKATEAQHDPFRIEMTAMRSEFSRRDASGVSGPTGLAPKRSATRNL